MIYNITIVFFIAGKYNNKISVESLEPLQPLTLKFWIYTSATKWKLKLKHYTDTNNVPSLLFHVDLIEEVPEVATTNPLAERLKQGAGKNIDSLTLLKAAL